MGRKRRGKPTQNVTKLFAADVIMGDFSFLLLPVFDEGNIYYFYNQKQVSFCWWWQLFLRKKMEECQMPGWLFASVAGHSGRKEEGMACEEHLINSTTGPPFPHLSVGFPPSAGVIPRPHQRATAAALGACPAAGLGVASEGPKPGDGGSATENPCFRLQSVLVSFGFCLLQTGSRGQGRFRFPVVGAQPGLRAPGMPGGRGVGWGGGCSEGKGK